MNPALSSDRKEDLRKGGVKILIAAGGSGGHIFPAVALARTLKKRYSDTDIRFVGSDKSLDRRIFEKEGFGFFLLSANKLPYKISPESPVFFLKLSVDVVRAFFIIASYRPDVVVGFGGYVSFPVIFASRLFWIPSLVHEQNVVAGRANSFLFKLANRIAVSFEETKKLLGRAAEKCVFTGNPIRSDEFSEKSASGDRTLGIRRFGLDASKFTILVIGGSQGAHFLNEVFIEALSALGQDLRASLQVIHITGVKDYEWAIGAYEELSGIDHRVHSFIDRIEEAYRAADLVVTRSGASAIFEIAFFGKPMILVPYPFALSHQLENAAVFAGKGAAVKIEESELSAGSLGDSLSSLIKDGERLRNLAEAARRLSVAEASDNLANEVLALVKR